MASSPLLGRADVVITAVHVVRALGQPEPHVLHHGPFVPVRVFGDSAGQPAWVESIFFEPHSDVAVLQETDESVLWTWREPSAESGDCNSGVRSFDDLDRDPAQIQTQLPAPKAEHDLFYCSHRGMWRWMAGHVVAGNGYIVCDEGEMPEFGDSGAPIFTADDRVVGVVSWSGDGGTRVESLSAVLPSWLVRQIAMP